MKFIAGEPMKPATNRFTGRSYSSCGDATCGIVPRRMTATRSPSVIASVWSCVTYTMVVPSRFWSLDTSVRVCTRSFASRLDSGSSMRNAAGSRTIARPMATRCRWPPDRFAGLRSRNGVRSRIRAASSTFSLMVAWGVLASFSAKPMFCRTVMCGYSA